MTSQPPPDDSNQPQADDPYRPIVEPQPLKFSRTPDVPGNGATFEAQVPGSGEPGAPAVTLAVTVDPSITPESSNALKELLFDRMRAAFDVLPDLPSGWDVPGGGDDGNEPFDLTKQLKIELGAAWPKDGMPVAVVVTVETTTGFVPTPPRPLIQPILRVMQPMLRALSVTQRYDDYWYARNSSSPPTAKVHVQGGQGTLRRPGGRPTDVHIPPPPNYPLKQAKAFILHAKKGAMDYTLNSGFYSPQHPNNQ